MLELVSAATGETITLDRDDLPGLAEQHGVPVDDRWGPGKIVQELFEKLVEEQIVEPTFVKDFPREVSPLARPHRDDPRLTEHFDLVIGGVELATAFSELTDPIEQRAKFEAQAAAKAAGDDASEAELLDAAEALDRRRPTYFGSAWVALGRLMLDTNELNCPQGG
jgi:lysyl-tRNA synthetase class 2